MLSLNQTLRLRQVYFTRCHILNKPARPNFRLFGHKLSGPGLEQLHAQLKNAASSEATNTALEHGLPLDFSLYYTVQNPESHSWSPGALRALIDSNPGRVFSLMSLLEKHGKEYLQGRGTAEDRDKVVLSVVKKLLDGEKSELAELEEHQVFKSPLSSIRTAVALINLCLGLEVVGGDLEKIFARLEEEGEMALLSSITLKGIAPWLQTKLNNATDAGVQFELSKILFSSEPLLLSKENLANTLKYAGTLKHAGSAKHREPKSGNPSTLQRFVDQVLQYIEENHLDWDKNDPNSLLLRMQLMESYLIDEDNVKKGLEKFHHYQTFEKFGLEFVQAKVVQGFCYQAVKHNDAMLLKIAEAYLDHENLAVSTLCQLILANSRFSSEKSLEIYNKYINMVSKEINEVTGSSPTGSLTQAMMVASLYDSDREFAQLLFEKAVTSGVVKDDIEIAAIKRVLKIYGDSFVENSWDVAKPIFERFVLESIRR